MKLTSDRIVDAGMATLADVGYDGLSMRLVAARLEAQAASLYYHVPSKAALLRLMADRLAQQAYAAATVALGRLPDDADWTARIEAQATALRDSIRRHAGGAVLLASSPALLSTGALSLMERLQETLADAGVPPAGRGVAADVVLSHVTGFVLQEQVGASEPTIDADEAATLRARFPLTIAHAAADQDEDQLFAASVRLLCRGIATLVASEGAPQPRSLLGW